MDKGTLVIYCIIKLLFGRTQNTHNKGFKHDIYQIQCWYWILYHNITNSDLPAIMVLHQIESSSEFGKCTKDGNINTYLKECAHRDWICLAQKSVQQQILLVIVIKCLVS
jgi:hypothetical protein